MIIAFFSFAFLIKSVEKIVSKKKLEQNKITSEKLDLEQELHLN